MRVLVFGDSIAYGSWDSHGGWVDRLKADYHKRTIDSKGERKTQVVNLGIGGDTSTKILQRMDAEAEARYSANWPFVFVIAFGTNDSRLIVGEAETSLEQYKDNITEIIKTALKYTDKVLFVGPSPLSKDKLNWKSHIYIDRNIQKYEDVQKEIVEAAGIEFIQTRSEFEKHNIEELFSYDELHPGDGGHSLIQKLVKQSLDKFINT